MAGWSNIVRTWKASTSKLVPLGGARDAELITTTSSEPDSEQWLAGQDPDGWPCTELQLEQGQVAPWSPGGEFNDAELDSQYFQALSVPPAGAMRDRTPPDEWVERLRQCAVDSQRAVQRLPRVPTVVPAMLRLLRNDSVSDADLAALAEHDLVVVAELLRTVNSAYHRPSRQITLVREAIQLMGRQQLRVELVRIAFRPVFNADKGLLTMRAAPRLLAQFELCARACHLLATAMLAEAPNDGPDEADVVLGGLTQGAGWMLLLRLLDSHDEINTLPESPAFWQALSRSAQLMAQRIAEQWAFPRHIAHAMHELASGSSTPSLLADVLRRADRIVKLRILADSGEWVCPSPRARAYWPPDERHCFESLAAEPEALREAVN